MFLNGMHFMIQVSLCILMLCLQDSEQSLLCPLFRQQMGIDRVLCDVSGSNNLFAKKSL